jgi:aryl-alcohol dehydrogenase-like predicted oxidoreductase
MRYRVLGRTGLRVSEIGFGAWAIGGNARGNSYGPTNDAMSVAAVRRALDLGCTFFDTADVYGWGHSEEILGEALEGHRDEAVIATKVGGDFYHGRVQMNFDPGYIAFALERSLRRLRTDRVDVYQLHNPPVDVLGDPATFDVLDLLRAENKIVRYGVSIHDPIEGFLCLESGKPDVLQVPFSLLRQEWDDLFAQAREANVGIIAREPLANGFLTDAADPTRTYPPGDIRHAWPARMVAARVLAARRLGFLVRDGRTLAQTALRFVLAASAVSVTIPGAKTPAQVEENLLASEATPLSEEELRAARDWYLKEAGLG